MARPSLLCFGNTTVVVRNKVREPAEFIQRMATQAKSLLAVALLHSASQPSNTWVIVELVQYQLPGRESPIAIGCALETAMVEVRRGYGIRPGNGEDRSTTKRLTYRASSNHLPILCTNKGWIGGRNRYGVAAKSATPYLFS